MAKKLSDIDLQSEVVGHGTLGGERLTPQQRVHAFKIGRNNPTRLKSFLEELKQKRSGKSTGTATVQPTKAFLGGSGSTVKDPEPPTEEKEDPINNDAVRESLKKTFERLRDILRLKRKNIRLRNNLNRKGDKPGDTPVGRRLGLGRIGRAAKAIVPVNILGVLGDLIGLAVLNWLGDPRNKKQVQMLVKIFTGIIKFLSWYISGVVNNLLGGFNQIIAGSSIAEKLVGIVKMFAGIVGLKWLMNPFSIIKDLTWGFNRLKKWPEILSKLFKGGSRKSIDAVFQKHNSLLRTSLTRTFKRTFLRIFGTFGKKILRSFVKPIVSKVSAIPFIGPIIAFLVNWIVFKEPPGRAAFKAVGAGLGMFLAGTAGSVIPILGTWVGAALGGLAGDWIGGAFYDLLFGGGDGKPGIVAGLTNAAGSLISWAWKIVKGIAGSILKAPLAIAKGVVNAGKAVIGGAKKAAGWVGNKAKGAWNWLTGGGKKKDTYTEPEVKTMIANAVSETSQVSQMSTDFEIQKKVQERRTKTRATMVAIQNRRVNTINISGSPDRTQNDDLNNSISDLLVLRRI